MQKAHRISLHSKLDLQGTLNSLPTYILLTEKLRLRKQNGLSHSLWYLMRNHLNQSSHKILAP